MPTKKPRDKFSAALVEPIRKTSAETYALIAGAKSKAECDAIYQSEIKRISQERAEKLRLLLDHYKIDPDNSNLSLQLALHLSMDFVPGMRVEDEPRSKAGRPRKWKGQDGDGEALIAAVEAFASKRKRGIVDAVALVKKHNPHFKEYSLASLEARYHEAVKRRADPRRFIEMAETLARIADSTGHE